MTVSEYCLRPVSKQEFDKSSLDPGQVSKTSPGQQSGTALSWKAPRDQDPQIWLENSERRQQHFLDRRDGVAPKSETAASRSQHWQQRDLHMRFVDKWHKGGQYTTPR